MWRLRRVFAMHYGYWDDRVRSLADSLARMNEVLADAVGVSSADRLLDAGCGVGGSAIHLARTRGCHVFGITLSRRQAVRARRHAVREGVADRVAFGVGDFVGLPFPDRSFDVVWALESACYADDKSAFSAEAARVLRPGGRLVLADGFLASRAPSPPERARVEAWLRCWAVRALETPAGFAERLREAGLTGVRFRDISAEVMPSAWRLWRGSLYAMTVTRICERLGLRSRVQTLNVVGCRRQYPLFRDGVVGYGILVASKPGAGGQPSRAAELA